MRCLRKLCSKLLAVNAVFLREKFLMLLDFNPETGFYFLLLKGDGAPTIAEMQYEHGWDHSETASLKHRCPVVFTSEPYAAAYFSGSATPAARLLLEPITAAVARSWAP